MLEAKRVSEEESGVYLLEGTSSTSFVGHVSQTMSDNQIKEYIEVQKRLEPPYLKERQPRSGAPPDDDNKKNDNHNTNSKSASSYQTQADAPSSNDEIAKDELSQLSQSTEEETETQNAALSSTIDSEDLKTIAALPYHILCKAKNPGIIWLGLTTYRARHSNEDVSGYDVGVISNLNIPLNILNKIDPPIDQTTDLVFGQKKQELTSLLHRKAPYPFPNIPTPSTNP